MSNKYVVIDLETTGNSVKKGDRIIQFAAVVIENNTIVEQFSSLLNPGHPIPIFIEELTGLSDEMVKDAPEFAEIAPKVIEMLNDAFFVAHNVLFDLSFLQEELIMAGYEGFYGPVLDTVEMARIILPSSDSYKLSDLALQEGLHHDRPHQADSDAYVTSELLLILFDRLRDLPLQTIKQLHHLSGGLKSDLIDILEEIIMDREKLIENVPNNLEEYRGICIKKSPHERVVQERDSVTYPLHDYDKEALLKKAFPAFESRQGQYQMMDIVYHSFQHERHAMVEAGTGVGKSFAYLLPALFTAVESREPVIISTYTTQLQEQLLQKDIPLLAKAVDFSFQTVLMKGKSHYISIEKFAKLMLEDEDNYDTTLTKMQILVWLTETVTGDRDELNLSSGGRLFWHRIKQDESVFNRNKSMETRDFYLNMREKAQKADIIITNHSMLLSSLAADKPLLPQSDYIIIDEGHHFEKVSGKYFGSKLDYASTRFFLQQMGLSEQKMLAHKIEKILQTNDGSYVGLLHTQKLNEIMSELLFAMDEMFSILAMIAKNSVKNRLQGKVNCPFHFDMTKEAKAFQAKAEHFLFLLTDFAKEITARFEVLKRGNDKDLLQKSIMHETASWLEDSEKLRQCLRKIIHQNTSEDVSWIDVDTRSWQNRTTLYSQPVSVSRQLRENLFQAKKSVIITSATLSVKGSFNYTAHALGLHTEPCHYEQIPSPFDYGKQVQLIISNDLPEVNTVPIQEYVSAISAHIISIAEATNGRLLILFTSYDMLRKTYELIKESGFLQEYSILAQGITGGSRTRLVKNFQRFDKAILLGTSSFWEGIDIPGEDLSCLIMVRLPFSPPDEPLAEAKCDNVKKNGGNPFYDYSLPEAVLRFKQGFGRLIRTKNDKGIMILFDRRIVSTQYGKVFLDSLPEVKAKKMNIDDTVHFIHKWL
ncbi:ATP-dependent DNA helicase DinG [Niallia oryzisoli]|uniref:ATP-dependent DNA helicase DinG n=1 Tax=Niallia oryzisoli TaxID=1737571 RepID=UPI003737006E